MIWLWIAAALVSAAAAALIVQRAAAGARRKGGESRELAIYRRQMSELDDLAARGLLAETDKRAVRAETGRRLLAAAARGEAPLRAAPPLAILAVAALAPLAALAAYVGLGAPTFRDQPFARRLGAWESIATQAPDRLNPLQLAAIWRAISDHNPRDATPLRELAIYELDSDQPTEALQALQRAVAIAPGRADLWKLLGEVAVVRAQGDVGQVATDAFRHALALDPRSATAGYYLARARIAGGDVAGGLAQWRALEAGLAPADPRRASLAADIRAVATTGRLAPLRAPAQPGVTQPQIQAMVAGLAARLAAHPDDPAGWARLVRAYTVLGDARRRDAALAQARRRYAADPQELQALQAATEPPSSAGADGARSSPQSSLDGDGRAARVAPG
ncbi:MAG TPA: c-type cytochrome biogenesis protein CcmI [Caulobacteraceae bacterium]|nr:c-type cytochrome biogenesis protein CcmI [Caulobacteraceae bacterium]